MSNGQLAIFAAIGANILWGSTFMASKVVLAQCPPMMATLIRFSIAALIFLVIIAFRKSDLQSAVFKSRIKGLLGLAAIGYTGLYALQMSALNHITSSQSAAIMLMAPVFTLMTESYFKKSIRPREAMTTLAGLIGASIILFDQYSLDFKSVAFQGLLLTVAGSLCLGLSVIQTKRLLAANESSQGFTVFNLTFYSLVIGAVGLLPFVAIELSSLTTPISLDGRFWMWSFYLGGICSVVAFLIWNWSIKHISSVVVSVSMYLKTPVALGIGAILLSEHLTVIFYGGTALILSTLFTNQLVPVRGTK